jgi:hypothetical protein
VLIGIALVSLAIGGVAAYLSMSHTPVKNTFTAETEAQPTIEETFQEDISLVKKNVCVNVGDPGYAVYVRAAVVITWQDDAGNVLAQSPVQNKDYTIQWNDGADEVADNDDDPWFQHTDGFWYCKAPVNSGVTPILIESCTPTEEKGDYHLNVEIIAQTIQALGTTDETVDGEGNPVPTVPAVTAAWGVNVSTEEATKGQLIP